MLTLVTVVRTRALEFVREVTDYVSANAIDADMVLNTDQSRFEYEITSNRTLSMTGEKTTEATVASVASTALSYTIQVLISMIGRLAKKLYICFQEAGGKFGKRVPETLQRNQPPFTKHDCSTRGKMSTALVLSWMRKVLQPELQGASLLLLDSWPGQTDTGLSARAFGNRKLNLHTKIIPSKTTKYCQPLDV